MSSIRSSVYRFVVETKFSYFDVIGMAILGCIAATSFATLSVSEALGMLIFSTMCWLLVSAVLIWWSSRIDQGQGQ